MIRRVDVLRDGVRIYRNMIDDPSLPFLHWGDSYGFVLRSYIRGGEWELRAR